MHDVTVLYHHEPPSGWWAESTDLEGWTAAAHGLSELQRLVEDGVRFALDGADVRIRHRLVDPPELELLFTREPTGDGQPELTVWTSSVSVAGAVALAA